MAFRVIANASDIEENQIYSFPQKHIDIAIVKKGEEYFAFEDVCSHDGGSISEGEVKDGNVVCPRHFAEFSLRTGEALSMPATEAIGVFPVQVRDGKIEVDWEV